MEATGFLMKTAQMKNNQSMTSLAVFVSVEIGLHNAPCVSEVTFGGFEKWEKA